MVEVLEQGQPWDRWLEAKASSQAATGQISGKTASCFAQNTKQLANKRVFSEKKFDFELETMTKKTKSLTSTQK